MAATVVEEVRTLTAPAVGAETGVRGGLPCGLWSDAGFWSDGGFWSDADVVILGYD